MKAKFLALGFLLLGAMLSPAAEPCEAKGNGKSVDLGRGGAAASHMSTKGSANSNAQWSADPTRGWVRAEERHQAQRQNSSAKSKEPALRGRGKSKSY